MKDKEKQIFDKYGNYDFPTEIKQEGLNNATSQIEEILSIAKIVDKKCDYIKCKNCNILDNYTDEQLKGLYCSEIKIAENICIAGYRKLPEDSVMLPKSEYNDLKEFADKYFANLRKDKLLGTSNDSVVLTNTEKEKLLNEMYEQGKFDALADLEKNGKVVISREEYEELEQNLDKLRQSERANILAEIADGGTSCHWCMEEHGKIGYEKGSKETAEKCNSILEKNYKDWLKVLNDLNVDTSNKNILVSIVCGLFKNSQEDIAKQFGVEIKE